MVHCSPIISRFSGFAQMVLLLSVDFAMQGQVKSVDSDWQEFAFPEGKTLAQAEVWVVEQAKIRAMAAEFGTRVRSETVQVLTDANGQVDQSFSELSVQQVQGQWVEDVELEGPYRECRDGDFWFRVRIRGKARADRQEQADLEMDLRADVACSQAVESLAHGERLRLRFSSPVDGHVMFFYIEEQKVYALSTDQAQWAVALEGQQVYSLFSSESEWVAADAEALGLKRLSRYAYGFQVTASEAKETQALLVGAFAHAAFAPPQMEWDSEDSVWTMTEEAFDRWLKQNLARTERFQVERLPVRIQPKQRY